MTTRDSTTKENHHLSLKVMRVSQPLLAASEIPFLDKFDQDDINIALSQLNENDITISSVPSSILNWKKDKISNFSLHDSGFSDLLTLPSSFGTPFLGETFRAYLCINNESVHIVQNVSLKIELQTTGNRFILFNNMESPISQLEPSETTEAIVAHEIKELGVHVLVCIVSYFDPLLIPSNQDSNQDSNSNLKTLRKFYKFSVSNPLAVKTKVNNHGMGMDDLIYLEVQLQNTSSSPMLIERITYEPAPNLKSIDLSLLNDEKKESIFESCFLSPQDIRQYLYALRSNEFTSPLSSPSKTKEDISKNALGRLDIAWRTSFGEFGRLQTSQLTRKAPPEKEDLEIRPIGIRINDNDQDGKNDIISDVAIVKFKQEFLLVCRCINNSKISRIPRLSVVKNSNTPRNVIWVKEDFFNLDFINPGEFIQFDLPYLPIERGLQKFDQLRLYDDKGFDEVIDLSCDVFVE